jgi:type I restriction enzyme M protein
MDFACGSGSLLLNVRKKVNKAGGTIGKIFGQEKNITTYNLARMNMLLHGVKDTEFDIFHGDTLLNEWDMMREQNPAKKPSFDAIVANPPFSYRWEPTTRWPTTCASRATASRPSPPPTSPSCCTASTTSRTKA